VIDPTIGASLAAILTLRHLNFVNLRICHTVVTIIPKPPNKRRIMFES